MTRRQRLEAKIGKRTQWAASAASSAEGRFRAAAEIGGNIPMGQPILVGHHSEGRHRTDIRRIDAAMERGCEANARAQHHAAKAAGLEALLDSAIFSDDSDAVEALEARIAAREARVAAMKAANATWKKAAKAHPDLGARAAALVADGTFTSALACHVVERAAMFPWTRDKPFDTTNAAASIRRDRERLAAVRQRRAHECAAQAAGGATIAENGFYATVRFVDRPDYEIIQSLKEAGFQWHGGAWHGRSDTIPAEVRAFVADLQKEIDNGSEPA